MFSRALGLSFLLVAASTFTSLATKIVYQLDGLGRDGEHKFFEKPWALTTVLFLGMACCLPLAYLQDHRQRQQQKAAEAAGEEVEEPLLGAGLLPPAARRRSGPLAELRTAASLCIVPTAFDLVATSLMNVGLLSLRASVFQMLRGGSELVFTRAFAAVLLRRRPSGLHLVGTGCSLAGIVLVALASILAGGGGPPGSTASREEMLWGIGLVVLSQGVQVAQFRYEDFYMADRAMPPLKMVGYEGLFGTLGMLGLVLPLAQWLPGEEGRGLHEDSLDTLAMIASSPAILGVLLGDIAALVLYNVAGMSVMGRLGSLFRTVLETGRTLLVWLGALLLFYLPASSRGQLGEPWGMWSWVQATGFLVLVCGTLLYSHGDEQRVQEQLAEEEQLYAEEAEAEAELYAEAGGGAGSTNGGLVPPGPSAGLARQESLPPRLSVVPPSVPISVAAASIKSTMNLSAFNLPRPMAEREADEALLSTTPRPHYAMIRSRGHAGSRRTPLRREPPPLLDTTGARRLLDTVEEPA